MATYVSHGDADDLKRFSEWQKSRRPVSWTVNPAAVPGEDEIIFYLQRPASVFAAVGRIAKKPLKDDPRWPRLKRADVFIERVADRPLPMREARELFPQWRWLLSPIHPAAVPSNVRRQLLRAMFSIPADRAVRGDARGGTGDNGAGAGFGSYDENKRVEEAAIAFAKKTLRREGWGVIDRQKDCCGYDLAASKGHRELHIEVKGVRGSDPSFVITRNEATCAQRDQDAVIWVVTNALSRRPMMRKYRGCDLRMRFDLRPLAFIAAPKPR